MSTNVDASIGSVRDSETPATGRSDGAAGRPGVLVAGRGLRHMLALTLAASAGVHAGLAPAHLTEAGPLLAGAFVASALVLAALAIATRSPEVATSVAAASAAVLFATAGAYLLSRTVGLPLLIPEPEEFDPLGVLTSLLELLGAAAATILLIHQKGRS